MEVANPKSQFPKSTRPKKGAKTLSRVLSRPLAQCQSAVAKACGYKDWHELEQQAAPGRNAILDQDLSADEYVNRQIEMTLSIAKYAAVVDDDAQFALAMANITGDRKAALAEQLAIRTGCLRRTSLPDAGRRQRGSIGRLKSPGRNGELVILKRIGRITYVLTHQSPDTAVADFEFVSPPPGAALRPDAALPLIWCLDGERRCACPLLKKLQAVMATERRRKAGPD